jgi:hypothetical protein
MIFKISEAKPTICGEGGVAPYRESKTASSCESTISLAKFDSF